MTLQCDPKSDYLHCEDEIKEAISRVLASGRYLLGDELEQFETSFAEYLGCPTVVGVANGTDAVMLALMSLDLEPLSQVATVSFTATASVNAIVRAGLRPVFVDVGHDDCLIDLDELEALLSSDVGHQIKAVLAVHLYGQVVEMERLLSICMQYDVKLIEDCAQAHGAEYSGVKVGCFGDAAAFSFYPTKNLGALGDGGAVVSKNNSIKSKLKSLRQYGWEQKHNSLEIGVNSRLDELQAAVLGVKLNYLDIANAKRVEIAKYYNDNIKNELVEGLVKRNNASIPVYHQYVLKTDERGALISYLQLKNIGCQIHYPIPVHQQLAFRDYPVFGELTVSSKLASQVISLPMYPNMSLIDQEKVVNTVNSFKA